MKRIVIIIVFFSILISKNYAQVDKENTNLKQKVKANILKKVFKGQWSNEILESIEFQQLMNHLNNASDDTDIFKLYVGFIDNLYIKEKIKEEENKYQVAQLQKDSAIAHSKLLQSYLESIQAENNIALLNQKKEIDSLELSKKQNQLLFQKLKSNTDSSKINFLSKEKNLQQQRAEQEGLMKNVFIGGFILALIVALLFINRYRIKKKSNILISKAYDDLKKTQQQLVQSEKMASLGQLTAGVAHEINNPMNFVSANITPLRRDINDIMSLLEKYASLDQSNYNSKLAEILKFKNDIDLSYTIKEIQSLINGIEEGSNRTTEIVKGLRNFSRLDEGEFKKACINEGIESTLLLVNNLLTKKNIEVVKSFGTIPEIKCYPGQINQVFMNLLSNAIDAIGENGKIFITTSAETDKVKISIRDTGKGMTEEIKQKIFDPFFTTKDVGKGTGLGLSISYGIIENHKGKIEVNSEVGKGSEFVIWLPV